MDFNRGIYNESSKNDTVVCQPITYSKGGNEEYYKKFIEMKNSRFEFVNKQSNVNKKLKYDALNKKEIVNDRKDKTDQSEIDIKDRKIHIIDSSTINLRVNKKIRICTNSPNKYDDTTNTISTQTQINNKISNCDIKTTTHSFKSSIPKPISTAIKNTGDYFKYNTKDRGTQIYDRFEICTQNEKAITINTKNENNLNMDSDDGIYIASFFKSREMPGKLKRYNISNKSRIDSIDRNISRKIAYDGAKWSREILKVEDTEPELFKSNHRYNNVPKRHNIQDKIPNKGSRVKKSKSYYTSRDFEGKLRYNPNSDISSTEDDKVDDDDDMSTEHYDSYLGFSPNLLESGDSEAIDKLKQKPNNTDDSHYSVKEDDIIPQHSSPKEAIRKSS